MPNTKYASPTIPAKHPNACTPVDIPPAPRTANTMTADTATDNPYVIPSPYATANAPAR